MRRNLIYLIQLSLILFFLFIHTAEAANERVVVLDIEGAIDRATVQLIKEGIEHAESIHAEAIVLRINTPGGGLDETEEIIEFIVGSDVPFIGYVPKGEKAWSAGTYILMACPVVGMGHHSVIGSCQPVEITPSGYKLVNDSKHINALKERIRNLAEMYGRNSTIAEEFVTENRNINATDALKFGVVEVVADSIEELLDKVDGMKANGRILNTKNATIVYHTPSLKYHVLAFLTDPVISSLLFILGIFSLLIGIKTPGYGAEVFGIIAIILALFGMNFSLYYPVIILVIVGIIMLIIELYVTPGFGIIGIGGIICIILASIFLVPSYPTRNWLITVDYQTLLLIFGIVPSILIAGFFFFVLYKIVQVGRKKPQVGLMEGEEAETLEEITPNKAGFIKYKGEYWLAKSKEGRIPPREKVIIEKRYGNLLVVSIKKEDSKD